MRSSVDLPEPFRPSTPILAPGKKDREMSRRMTPLRGHDLADAIHGVDELCHWEDCVGRGADWKKVANYRSWRPGRYRRPRRAASLLHFPLPGFRLACRSLNPRRPRRYCSSPAKACRPLRLRRRPPVRSRSAGRVPARAAAQCRLPPRCARSSRASPSAPSSRPSTRPSTSTSSQQQSANGRGYLDAGDTPAFARRLRGRELRRGRHAARRGGNHGRPAPGAASFRSAGLHHAARAHAAGFCVFNDCGVAIELLRRRHGLRRVAYVDIDAHHGDGVFYGFESDPDVLFADIHEDGRYLYPGTGARSTRPAGRGGRHQAQPAAAARGGDDEFHAGLGARRGLPATHPARVHPAPVRRRQPRGRPDHAPGVQRGGARARRARRSAGSPTSSATAACWRWAAAATTGRTSRGPGRGWWSRWSRASSGAATPSAAIAGCPLGLLRLAGRAARRAVDSGSLFGIAVNPSLGAPPRHPWRGRSRTAIRNHPRVGAASRVAATLSVGRPTQVAAGRVSRSSAASPALRRAAAGRREDRGRARWVGRPGRGPGPSAPGMARRSPQGWVHGDPGRDPGRPAPT